MARRLYKILASLVLLPLCLAATITLGQVLTRSGSADQFWAAALAGAGCWLVIYLLLPRPMLIYVFGHELTHALWAWMFGGKVKKFRATSKGGHVLVTKSNFLIVLAPYFFPIYVVLITLVFVVGHLIWGWTRYLPFFHLLVGAAYCFHFTLTLHVLQTRQSDISSQGWFFSAVVIWLGNVVILLVALPALTARVTFLQTLQWTISNLSLVLRRLMDVF